MSGRAEIEPQTKLPDTGPIENREEVEDGQEEHVLPPEIAKGLVSGTSTLGIGALIERSSGFLANILAARLGGAQTFGAYALAISTANNVSAYAAGGIGSTAIRFSGTHPIGTPGYTALARSLAIVAAVSATLAACTLWLGAVPLAHLLRKPELTVVLRWAGCSAAAVILIECCRGFFVGQKRLKALLCLSGCSGAGLLLTLPLASSFGPSAMLIDQSLVATGAVLVCLLFYRGLGLVSPVKAEHLPREHPHRERSLLRHIWEFSGMQIAGIVSMNIAGWWLTTLVAKSDTTMVQMGFFAVAHQLRNMVALVPSLLIEGSFAEMTEGDGSGRPKTPDQVTAVCTYVATLASLTMAGVGIVAAPWVLTLIYGKAYGNASAAASIALATAVVHMGSGAASSRVSILSIRTSMGVNTTWALFVGTAATIFLFRGADAAKGASVYLGAHIVTATLFLFLLRKWGNATPGMISTYVIGAACGIALAALSILRTGSAFQAPITVMMICIWGLAIVVLIQIGKRRRWLPSRVVVVRLGAKLIAALRLRFG